MYERDREIDLLQEERERMSASSMVAAASYMALNFCTSILIIWTNKLAYQKGFKWALSLTVLHFCITFLGLEICARCGLFVRKQLKVRSVVPISTAFCGFVLFNNLSLQYNVVGMYQLLKVMTTPCIVCMQFFLYQVSLPRDQMIALVPICVGVAIATVSSIDVNFWGLFWGIAGILSTSIYQIWVKTEQSNLEASSQQLLYYQAPVSAFMLICIIPFVEDIFGPEGLLSFQWEPVVTFYVFLSSALAFLVNLSIYLVISSTSPVSYNVLGHGKLCVILASGFLLFGDSFSFKIFLGVVTTFGGVVYYTNLKLQTQSQASLAVKDPKMDIDSVKNNDDDAAAAADDQDEKHDNDENSPFIHDEKKQGSALSR